MSLTQQKENPDAWAIQSMSARGHDFERKLLAKKNGDPVAWRLVRKDCEDTLISYPTWWKHATEDELQEAYGRLEVA